MKVGSKIKKDDRIVGRILADKYEIEKVIREDDIGTVYLARHVLMDKLVTVKTLSRSLAVDPQIVERFSLEAKTISRLSHPNILNVTDFGEDLDGTVFVVLEYYEGIALKELLVREGALSVERSARITRQIAAALSAAHSSGIIHTSLSSKNVLIYDSGNGRDTAKIFDIGSFSSNFKTASDFENSIEEVAYLSPEQCSRQSDPDERSDIYSLGIIFYELLTGEVPFIADTVTELMIKHAEVPPPPLAAFRADVPDEIEPILLNALAKNPDRRFQTAAAFAEDLGEALSEKIEDETVIIPGVDTVAATGRNIWKTAFIVLAGITVFSLGMIYWTRTDSTVPVTTLPTDENSQPVQPLNPATGINEQGNLMMLPPGTLVQGDPNISDPSVGGGDGYDPWANLPVPPAGRGQDNTSIGPGGEMYTIPGDGSIFMPDADGSGGVILVPKIVPEDTPSPQSKSSPVPTKTPGQVSPSPFPEKVRKPPVSAPPASKPKDPKAQPKDKKPVSPSPSPSSGNSKIKSGVENDT